MSQLCGARIQGAWASVPRTAPNCPSPLCSSTIPPNNPTEGVCVKAFHEVGVLLSQKRLLIDFLIPNLLVTEDMLEKSRIV